MTIKEQNIIRNKYEKMRERLADICSKCGEKIVEGGCYDVPTGGELMEDLCASCFAEFENNNNKKEE